MKAGAGDTVESILPPLRIVKVGCRAPDQCLVALLINAAKFYSQVRSSSSWRWAEVKTQICQAALPLHIHLGEQAIFVLDDGAVDHGSR